MTLATAVEKLRHRRGASLTGEECDAVLEAISPSRIVVDDHLVVDPACRTIILDGKVVALPGSRAFDLLALLASYPRRVWTHAEILERVWGYSHGFVPASRPHAVAVQRLRVALEHRYIYSVHAVGYRLLER